MKRYLPLILITHLAFGMDSSDSMNSSDVFSDVLKKTIETILKQCSTRQPFAFVEVTLDTGESRGQFQTFRGYIGPIKKSPYGESLELFPDLAEDTAVHYLFPSDLKEIKKVHSPKASSSGKKYTKKTN